MRIIVVGVLISLLASTAYAGSKITYAVNGADYEGYHAKAKGNSKGIVLVIHDWDGLTDYEVKRADMLASMGYDAFAVDLYGKGNRPVATKAKKAETGKLYKNRQKMRTLILAGLSEARRLGNGPAVVMGYCFGGAATLELARSGKAENVKGYATFHGGLSTPSGQSYPNSTAPILVAHGGADTAIKMADVAALADELEVAGVTYDIEVYSGAPHAFTVFGSKRYREYADKKSWNAFSDFLQRQLGG
ncbi:MAG: dienelactone hydrolase family protein [Hyphomicrobiaceae bacterium]